MVDVRRVGAVNGGAPLHLALTFLTMVGCTGQVQDGGPGSSGSADADAELAAFDPRPNSNGQMALDPSASADAPWNQPENQPGGESTGENPSGETPSGETPSGETPVEEPTGPYFALDECGLDTGYPGDDQCILPPPPDKGFQIHIGPDDYNNIDAVYLLQPGQEATDDFKTVTSNTELRHFYYRQYRMRPTAHHMIVEVEQGGAFSQKHRIATANVSQDFPAGGVIAPENAGVASPIEANSDINVSLHAINVSDQPALREIWVNFWYRDEAEVTDPAEPVFELGSTSFSIAPGVDTILGPYTCDINQTSRMLWLYGHRHANNLRFSVWRERGTQIDVLYEGFHWEEPLQLQYDSVTENQVADRDLRVEGGWSGPLDLEPGDKVRWECHVVNNHDTTVRFTNNTFTGEMCIIDAEMVGGNCQ